MSTIFRLLPGLLTGLALSAAALTPLRAAPPAAGTALYVANLGDGAILRCDGKTGKALSVLGSGLSPVGMALGPDRRLYVTSFGDGAVSRFDLSNGKSLGTFIPSGRGDLGQPVCLTFGPDGNLYVGNWKHNDVRRYDGKTGAFLGVFAKQGSAGLAKPGDLTFGPGGDLFVTNNSASAVLRFSGKTGASKGVFIAPGSGGLVDPENLAFDPAGRCYVGGRAGVLQYSPAGKFVRVFAAPSAHLRDVGGLAFGPGGDLYVGDWQKNDIVRYSGATGAYKGVFVPPAAGLMANRYILFGPRGGGGVPAAVAAVARAKRQKAMQAAQAARPAPPPLLAAGTPAPDFAATAPDGTTVHLSDFKGRTVVLDFWSTWCGPCQMSMPHLEKVYKQLQSKGAGQDVAVLGVCVWDEKAAYDKWVTDNKNTYTFPTAFDPAGRGPNGIAASLYKVSGIPTQYIIDKDGKVVEANVGYDSDDHRLEAALTKLGVPLAAQQAAK